MADKENTEVPPAPEAPAPVETEAPTTVVRQKRNWLKPVIAALVVVVALVVGGFGGYAIAAATDDGGRPAFQQGQFPGQNGPLGERPGERPDRSSDDSTEESDSSTEDSTED